MKYFAILFLLVACGEKRNPDRCCVDEADCAAIGLPNGSTCQPGELCRGNECVEQTCSMSSQCDLAAPYCESGHCAEMCTSDTSCPVTSPEKPFCVSGGCVECRETSDCGDLVCRNGSCGTCATDGECPSGLCVVASGLCADLSDVAFVAANGSPTSSCTQSAPCTLLRALAIDPPRTTIKMAGGTYTNASTITLEGKRNISGESMTTRITSSATGPVFVLGSGSEVTFDRVEIFGAKNGAELGVGVRCSLGTKLRMSEVRIATNASDGLLLNCDAAVSRSTITSNTGFGVRATGDMTNSYKIERSTISSNTAGGISATGNGTLQNLFVFANSNVSLLLNGTGGVLGTRPQVSFTTVVGNTAMSCFSNSGPRIPFTNCIVEGNVNNQLDTNGLGSCDVANCVTSGLANEPACSVTQFLHFKDPPAGDYHLLPNLVNPAINGASGGAGLLDFDGELRPKGAAADVGADEVQ